MMEEAAEDALDDWRKAGSTRAKEDPFVSRLLLETVYKFHFAK